MMVDGKGTLCCHFGGDTGGQGGCVGCAESSLDECSDDRAAQFQVVDDGFAAVLADLCRGAGLKAADWVMELFPLEAAFAGGGDS
ncbi:hypothetical protein JCM18916_1698 [Cutibacterium acnes JCM 18916]|nr:hypothetical protein JCM18916_1698 [Cutibacterium acnes JCM 18916]